MRRLISSEAIAKRNVLIIDAINAGITLSKTGVMFGISRERVAQIFYRATHKSVREIELKKKLVRIKHEIEMTKRNKPICRYCGGEILDGHKKKYCSRSCHERAMSRRKREDVTYICAGCGIWFHPWSTTKYAIKNGRSKRHYHSEECYMAHRPFGREKK